MSTLGSITGSGEGGERGRTRTFFATENRKDWGQMRGSLVSFPFGRTKTKVKLIHFPRPTLRGGTIYWL